ncbi:MAG: helix-turn-helix domain-containing protein [Solibacillus sp.]
MNFKLLYEMFPQLTPYNATTRNKYVFESERGLLEAPKHQLTTQELNYLSIFLKPIQENFPLQHLWMRFLTGSLPQPPEKFEHYQLLKFVFTQPFHAITELQLVFEAIVQQNCYILEQDHYSCIVLLIDEGGYIDFTPYKSLMEDDLKCCFSILTTPYENGNKSKAQFDVLQSIPIDYFRFNSSIYELDELILLKMLNDLPPNESQQFLQTTLQASLHEPVLLETVACYIQAVCNFTQTAKSLYIHRNTLQKRLNRFEQLSNKNLKDGNDLFKIATAIKLYNMHTSLEK